jgi:hypothetical protein
VSSFVLSVIPDDPEWQPSPQAADAAMAVLRTLMPDEDDDGMTEFEITWHEQVTVVDAGENLGRVGCPACGAEIPLRWWNDHVEELAEAGWAGVTDPVAAPCCGASVRLPDMEFDWPTGFARFELEVWEPGRDVLTADELAAVGAALGCGVRQVMAHF